MLAPRRLDTPTLVPHNQTIHKTTSTSNEEPNGSRRKGMVEGDGEWREQSQEMMTENIKLASSTHRKLLLPLFKALPTPEAVTIDTVSITTTTPAVSKPEEGGRVGIETLPVQDQSKPNIAEPKLEAQTLPGVNQDTSNMGEVPKSAPSGVGANSEGPSTAPAITVNKPLPGQNQMDPIVFELASPILSPLTVLPLPTPSEVLPATPLIHRPTTMSSSLCEASMSLVQCMTTSYALPTLATPTLTSSSISISSFAFLSATSFATITLSEQGKEAAPVTLAQSTPVSTSTASAQASSADDTTPQAIVVVQSFTGISTSTAAIAAATIVPVAVSNEQDGSNLHPTARTLLILFVILGALSILAAIIVLIIIKFQKQSSQTQQHTMIEQTPYDVSSDRVGVTTHISANSSDNPFLTPSEKAIIERAASPKAYNNPSNSPSFSDAISLFIKKSRRTTYKISP